MTMLTMEKYAELWTRLAAGAMSQMNAESEEAAVGSAANVATSLMDRLEAQLEKIDETVDDYPEGDMVKNTFECPKCYSEIEVESRRDIKKVHLICNQCATAFVGTVE